MHDPLFLSDPDRYCFLNYLVKYSDLFSFRIHAWCLMNNHLHLLAESNAPNLSEFMRRLLTAYTVMFHRRHKTRGHLFSGRFQSLVVDKADYLLSLSRYIHLNPVKAGIAKRAEDYTWSSMKIYMNPSIAPPYMKTDEILSWFGGKPQDYALFVKEGLNEEIKPEVLMQRFVGGKHFAKRIYARMSRKADKIFSLPGEKNDQKAQKHFREGEKYVHFALKIVCDQLKLNKNDLFAKTRRRGANFLALMTLIPLIRNNTEWTFRDIADYFGITVSYVQRMFGKAQKDMNLLEKLDEISLEINNKYIKGID